MKVYAEYCQQDNIRRKTLLQFGNSIELIGSAVLLNPGGAAPSNNDFDKNIITEFYKKVHKIDIETENWCLFNNDPTMRCLERIFNGWYVNENNKTNENNITIELNGIIQLFNCFYYMDQDRANAIRHFINERKFVFDESQYFLNKPVYFGWGDLDDNDLLNKIARKIFTDYNRKFTPIYNDTFENNNFYHPLYVNRSFRRNENVKRILENFHKLFL
ncbi:MAG: hypothetical protein FWB86_12685 [Treponema sp.]|nr:hypothetical protein [Treponema sp.]